MNQAVEDCLKAAGIVHDPEHQKTLMKAAQFGTAFCKINSSSSAQWVIFLKKNEKQFFCTVVVKSVRVTKSNTNVDRIL